MKTFWMLMAGIVLLLLGCGPNHVKTNSHIDWRAPIFLDSGKIGFFQIAWDEVYTTCGFTSNTVCGEPKRPHTYFITFSPADSSLDTLFEAAPRDYDFSIDVRVEHHPPWLYYHYAGTHAAYNFTTGQHRTFQSLGVFLGKFSRTGRYLVYDQRRVEVATGTVEKVLSAPWEIDYYDDVAGKALLYRWSTSDQPGSYMVLYDFATGAMDGTRVWPGTSHVNPVDGGKIIIWDDLMVVAQRKLLFARAQTLDITNPSLDSLLIFGSFRPFPFSDLDVDGRRLVGTNPLGGDFELEKGIAVTDFDGNQTVYRARSFHPEYPETMPLPP